MTNILSFFNLLCFWPNPCRRYMNKTTFYILLFFLVRFKLCKQVFAASKKPCHISQMICNFWRFSIWIRRFEKKILILIMWWERICHYMVFIVFFKNFRTAHNIFNYSKNYFRQLILNCICDLLESQNAYTSIPFTYLNGKILGQKIWEKKKYFENVFIANKIMNILMCFHWIHSVRWLKKNLTQTAEKSRSLNPIYTIQLNREC